MSLVGPFRIGLAGAGRMGRTHLQALAESALVSVVAVTDPVAQIREALAVEGLRAHADLGSMLAAGGLDGVLVATPTDTHLESIRQVTAAGLPVLCEKPCGLTSAQAREAAAVAAASTVPLQVAYWRRYVPELRVLRERIRAGELGDIYFVASSQWDERPPAATFRSRSGGIFIDMGVHEFDQVRWLTGQEFGPIHSVSAAAAFDSPVPGDAESAQALAELSGGATALVSLGRRHPPGDICRVETYGTEGVADCRFLWPPYGESVFLSALRLQAEDFARFARGGEPEGATAKDAVASLEAAERSAVAWTVQAV